MTVDAAPLGEVIRVDTAGEAIHLRVLLGVDQDGQPIRLAPLQAVRDVPLGVGDIPELLKGRLAVEPDPRGAVNRAEVEDDAALAAPLRGNTETPLVPTPAGEAVPDVGRLLAVALRFPGAGNGDRTGVGEAAIPGVLDAELIPVELEPPRPREVDARAAGMGGRGAQHQHGKDDAADHGAPPARGQVRESHLLRLEQHPRAPRARYVDRHPPIAVRGRHRLLLLSARR